MGYMQIRRPLGEAGMKICPECGRTLHEGFQICPTDGAKLAAPGQILRGGPTTVSSASSLRQATSKLSAYPPWWQILLAVAAVAVIGCSVYMCASKAYTDSHPHVATLDDYIQSKQYDKALEILEGWRARGLQTRADREKLDEVRLEAANAACNEKKFDEAVALLQKIDGKSPKYKDAQRLIGRCRTSDGIGFNAHGSGSVK